MCNCSKINRILHIYLVRTDFRTKTVHTDADTLLPDFLDLKKVQKKAITAADDSLAELNHGRLEGQLHVERDLHKVDIFVPSILAPDQTELKEYYTVITAYCNVAS